LKRAAVLLALFVLSVVVLTASAAEKPSVEAIAGKLSCFCGTCPHLVVSQCGCTTANQIMGEIKNKIDAGMTETQIINSFVDEYGPSVLSAPPRKGFNLTAYGIPLIGFLIGGTVLFVFLKHQQKPGDKVDDKSTTRTPSSSATNPEDQYYDEQLEDELNQRR
jgi:cytochrome c-type biogenesis protein CcmH